MNKENVLKNWESVSVKDDNVKKMCYEFLVTAFTVQQSTPFHCEHKALSEEVNDGFIFPFYLIVLWLVGCDMF